LPYEQQWGHSLVSRNIKENTANKPPSRERYERENPNVAFRVAREKKEQLEEMVEAMETIKKDWLETVIDETDQDYTSAREEARESGYKKAKEKFQVPVPCADCGKAVSPTEEAKNHLWTF